MNLENTKKILIGIDLGTSNCSLSFSCPESKEIKDLEIEQISTPGFSIKKKTLPSYLYVLSKEDPRRKDCKLPWNTKEENDTIIGEWAKASGRTRIDLLALICGLRHLYFFSGQR